ncbi:hypothetical protein VNI00_017626 [Paramarasmius palmivorus]|uniref:C2H2-type domain-containing protein n=1 Tax=Paramarasmius palmivorus TaxID=297713 RepID=A0AAW0B4H8_9AGAR
MNSGADFICPAQCGRFFQSKKGLSMHLSQARSCQWYRSFEKSTNFDLLHQPVQIEDLYNGQLPIEDIQQAAQQSYAAEEDNDIFHFVRAIPPVEDVEIGEAGPGPSTSANQSRLLGQHLGATRRILDEYDDRRIEVEDLEAGLVIRMDESLHEKWRRNHTADSLADDPMDGGGSAGSNDYGPFASQIDWEVARWAVKDNIGHNSLDRLLAIPGVVEKLGLSYKNVYGLHKAVDSVPPRAGKWKIRRLNFRDRPGEEFILRYRNPLDAIQSLWGDPHLSQHLVYRPKTVFENASKERRIYSEMWTGKLWALLQSRLPKGATLAPVIIATDKTQLTQFSGSKQAYPVYLTLGNIPKALRRKPSQRACILIGYLPVDKISKGNLSGREHSARYQRLLHEAMRYLLSPLVNAGRSGVEMVSADGVIRRVHPILTSYIADFPEQCLVTCSKYGVCPKCQVTASELANPTPHPRRTEAWTQSVMQSARQHATPTRYFEACMEHEVSGYVYDPFWKDLPYSDIHFSIMPDILHQLYQGVLRHLINWCQTILHKDELDRRIRCLPESYGVRHFKNGISSLSQISGMERKNMGKILLGCLIGSTMPKQAISACRAILDFIYMAQFSAHDDSTLEDMAESLQEWNRNKECFIQMKVHDDLNIPKFHSLQHYIETIRFCGTPDNFNTEMFERLHIDFAKKGWRASNKRDEFPQMTQWLTRQENVETLERQFEFLKTDKGEHDPPSLSQPIERSLKASQTIFLPKTPSAPNKRLDHIETTHRVPHFEEHLKRYLETLHPSSRRADLHWSTSYTLPFNKLDVFYGLKLDLESLEDGVDGRETIRATPRDGGRFDTVVVLTGDEAETTGLRGTRIARVKVIFQLPSSLNFGGLGRYSSPAFWPKEPLAYVEWFTAPTLSVSDRKTHDMPRISKAVGTDGSQTWSIVPLSNIRQSCMLFPDFKRHSDSSVLTSSTVLDMCSSFYLNNWSSLYAYKTLYKV